MLNRAQRAVLRSILAEYFSEIHVVKNKKAVFDIFQALLDLLKGTEGALESLESKKTAFLTPKPADALVSPVNMQAAASLQKIIDILNDVKNPQFNNSDYKDILRLKEKKDLRVQAVTQEDIIEEVADQLEFAIKLAEANYATFQTQKKLHRLRSAPAASENAAAPAASAQSKAELDEKVKDYTCPIFHTVFRNPVALVPGGQIVEEDAAKYLLGPNGDRKNPFNRATLTGYVPALPTKSGLEDFLKLHPEYKADQYQPSNPQPAAAVAPQPAAPIVPQSFGAAPRAPWASASAPAPASASSSSASAPARPPVRSPAALSAGFFGPEDARYFLPAALVILNRELTIDSANELVARTILSGHGSTRFANILGEGQASRGEMHGVDFRTVQLGERKNQIWDTPVQERFSFITGNYFRSANIVLLFGDAADVNHRITSIFRASMDSRFSPLVYELNFSFEDGYCLPLISRFDLAITRGSIATENSAIYKRLSNDVLGRAEAQLERPAPAASAAPAHASFARAQGVDLSGLDLFDRLRGLFSSRR